MDLGKGRGPRCLHNVVFLRGGILHDGDRRIAASRDSTDANAVPIANDLEPIWK